MCNVIGNEGVCMYKPEYHIHYQNKAVLEQVLKILLTSMKLCPSESKPAMWNFNNVHLKIIKNEKVIIIIIIT